MKLFVVVFVALVALVAVQNLMREKKVGLSVQDNAGVTVLETVGDRLVSVFQDGQTVVWDWETLEQIGNFRVISDRAVLLDSENLAAVNTTAGKTLTLYSLPSGKKQKDLSVGREDQEAWLRISPDKKTIALIRRNPPNHKDNILFEFLTIDLEKEVLSPPATFSIDRDTEDFVEYALDNKGILYAAGNKSDAGRIVAIDLLNAAILWNIVYDDTKELCSIAMSLDKDTLYAGSRDGFLYKIHLEAGKIIKKIQLLKKGETRPITNDYSVFNLAFSPDGQYFVSTIHPKAYLLKTDSDEIFHTCSPADRLISKIVFSPDNMFFATSDIRAGYPVKVWNVQQGE